MLSAVIQTYSGDEFFRERLVLSADSGRTHHLTLHLDRPHCRFGSLSIPVTPTDRVTAEELRLATWNGEVHQAADASSFDNNILEQNWRRGRNLEQNYMYHPTRIFKEVTRSYHDTLTGPFCIFYIPAKNRGVWTSYEHGAPDGDVQQAYFSILTEPSDTTLRTTFSVNRGAYFDSRPISRGTFFNRLVRL